MLSLYLYKHQIILQNLNLLSALIYLSLGPKSEQESCSFTLATSLG